MTTINSTTDIRVWLDNAGLLEHLDAKETDRVVELLADAEGRPAYGEDWGDYLDARAQAFVFEVVAELDGEREDATKMEAELADRRAHDEDVRTCLEYCDEDDPTPGGIGELARELLKWLRGFEGGVDLETETADDYSRRKPETRVGGAWSRRSRGD